MLAEPSKYTDSNRARVAPGCLVCLVLADKIRHTSLDFQIVVPLLFKGASISLEKQGCRRSVTPPPTPLLSSQTFRAGGARMMQTDTKKGGGVEHERLPHSKNRSRSHHVELVLVRIFAKQRGHAKQRSIRYPDLESMLTDWH